MHRIPLTPSRSLDGLMLLSVALMAGLVFLVPVIDFARPTLVAAVALVGIGQWGWHRHHRPVGIRPDPSGGLLVELAHGSPFVAMAVERGVIHPWLVSVRLVADDGRRALVFLPGWSLPAVDHWRLRRALLGWRPPRGRIGNAEPAPPV